MNPTEEQLANRLTASGLNPEQQAAVTSGVGIVNQQPISSTSLAPTQGLDLPPTPSDSPDIYTSALKSLQGLIDAPETSTGQTQTDIVSQLLSTARRAGQRTETQFKTEEAAGLPAFQKQLGDVNAQIRSLTNEALAIPLQIQQEATGRGVTAGGVAPIQTARLRENAIKSLSLSATAQALQGNVALAQQQADRAVQLEFAPIEAELDYLKTAYSINKDILDREDKKRSQQLEIALNERTRILDEQKQDRKTVQDIGMKLASFGIGTDVVSKVQGAKTVEEAISMASPYLQDPAAKQALENARLDNILTKTQIAKTGYELSLLQKYGGMTPAQYADSLKEEKKTIAATKDESEKARQQVIALGEKINVIGAALNSDALATTVGPSFLARGGFFGVGSLPERLSGSRQNFIASVENLVSREFLDSLISVKAQGATFGALTEKEQDALTNAATKISKTWRIVDKDTGQVLGYNASEKDFKEELQRIQNLTRKAYEVATGNTWTDDEQSLWDELENTQIDFSPAF